MLKRIILLLTVLPSSVRRRLYISSFLNSPVEPFLLSLVLVPEVMQKGKTSDWTRLGQVNTQEFGREASEKGVHIPR